jgi:acyl carrier protein phosphodiesterase
MNHLAHVVLSGDDDLRIVGGLLGDFWRGAPDPAWPDELARGVKLHRKIDVTTDAHPAVRTARALFDPPLRRYAGIVLDVWFDHLLAKDFEARVGVLLDRYIDRIDPALALRVVPLPPAFEIFLERTRRHRTLGKYDDLEFVEQVYESISQRLSRDNPVDCALPAIFPLERELSRAFDALWPDLVALATGTIGVSPVPSASSAQTRA